MILSAEAVDYFLGNAGWAGAGLLGLVLAWLLLKYLPAQEARMERIIESQGKQIDKLNTAFDARLKEVLEYDNQRLSLVMDSHKQGLQRIVESIEKIQRARNRKQLREQEDAE